MVFFAKFKPFLLSFVFAAVLVLVAIPVAVNAQESPDEGFTRELEEDVKKPPSPDGGEKSERKISLDELFASLKLETDSDKAGRLEKQIWRRWGQSGSDTVDLLMDWASIAMKEKSWATALDLLDQVVVMAPQYAEGWNRRATLYFLRSNLGRSIYDIEQVLKLERRHFGALAGLGTILQKLDEEKRSLVIWKNLLEIYPANKNAQKWVSDLEEKLGGRGT